MMAAAVCHTEALKQRRPSPAAVEIHDFALEPFADARGVVAAVLKTLGRFVGDPAPASLEDLGTFRRTDAAARAFRLRSRFGSYWPSSGFGLPHGIAVPQLVSALQAWLSAQSSAASASVLLDAKAFVVGAGSGKLILKPPGGAKLEVHTDQISPEGLRLYLEQARPTLKEAALALGVQAVVGLAGPAATEVPTNVTPQRLWWLAACCAPEYAPLVQLRVGPGYYSTWGGKAAGHGCADLFRGPRQHPAVLRVMEALETGAADSVADVVRSRCEPEFLEWLRADDRAGKRLPAPGVVVAGGPGELLLMLHGVPHGAASVKGGRLAGTAKFRPLTAKACPRDGSPSAGRPKHRTWSIPEGPRAAFQAAWDEASRL